MSQVSRQSFGDGGVFSKASCEDFSTSRRSTTLAQVFHHFSRIGDNSKSGGTNSVVWPKVLHNLVASCMLYEFDLRSS